MLPDRGRILVHSRASNGAGGFKETYVPGPLISCRIAPVGRGGTAASTVGERISEATTHITTWPAGTVVRAVDRVEVIDLGVFAVTALREFGALSFTRRVEVRELD